MAGIAPLFLTSKKRIGITSRILTNIGGGSLDVGGFIVPQHEPSIYDAFIQYLVDHQVDWDILELNEYQQDDNGTINIENVFFKHGYAVYKQSRPHYYLAINGSWEDYWRSVSQNLRGDLRRKVHRAEELGRLVYVHHRGQEVTVEDLNAVYRINSHGRHAYLFKSRQERNFQKELRLQMMTTNCLDIHLLFIAGKPTAYRHGFYYEDRIEDWRNSFDTRFFEFSAGKILLMRMMENAFNSGCKEVDFLRGDEEYKTRWKTSERIYLHLRFTRSQKMVHWFIYIFLPKIKLRLKNLRKA
jgi:hypothetical protein